LPEALVRLEKVKKYFPLESGVLGKLISSKNLIVRAVDDISFEINKGEIFTLVGETGSGKTTTGKLAVGLLTPSSGRVYWRGKDLKEMNKSEARTFKRNLGMVFQNPLASLNPRMRVEDIIGLPLKIHKHLSKSERRGKVLKILDRVGLRPAEKVIGRNPREFSGGQRQRIGIARAIAINPAFVVLDEPVASLDVSIRAQVLNLLKDLKDEFELTYLLVSHDLSMVQYLGSRVLVMYLGRPVELATRRQIFTSAKHPYTKALISSVPIPDPTIKLKITKLKGKPASPLNPPSGCRFHTRCPNSISICTKIQPEPVEIEKDHFVFCHLYT
jgi:oligopeptide transport system ATP-binding protein